MIPTAIYVVMNTSESNHQHLIPNPTTHPFISKFRKFTIHTFSLLVLFTAIYLGFTRTNYFKVHYLKYSPHITTTPFSCNWVSLFTPQNQFLCPPIVCYGWPPFFQVVGIAQKVGPMFWPFMATEKCNLLGWQLSTVVIYKIS